MEADLSYLGISAIGCFLGEIFVVLADFVLGVGIDAVESRYVVPPFWVKFSGSRTG